MTASNNTAPENEPKRRQNQPEGRLRSDLTFSTYRELFERLEDELSRFRQAVSHSPPNPDTGATDRGSTALAQIAKQSDAWIEELSTVLSDFEGRGPGDEVTSVLDRWRQATPEDLFHRTSDARKHLEGASTDAERVEHAVTALSLYGDIFAALAGSETAGGADDVLSSLASKFRAVAAKAARVENELERE